MKSVYVRDDLHRRLKLIAAEQSRPIIQVLEDLLLVGLRQYEMLQPGWERVAMLSKELYAEAEELAGLTFDYTPEDEAELAQAALGLGDLIPEVLETAEEPE
jgi:hypothetical protein